MSSETNGIAISPDDLSRVSHALEVVYSPSSTNAIRAEATSFLESAKLNPLAPKIGFHLASDLSQPAAVRHFGLQMLEYPIKYRWEDLEDNEKDSLRMCVLSLAELTTDTDPAFVRNKTAQLWEEVAKRCWGSEQGEWSEMDKELVKLWDENILAKKAVVLYVLETLSDEVFNREDATAALRGNVLARACVEIWIPIEVLKIHYPQRDNLTGEIRHGIEGWLLRLCRMLDECLVASGSGDERVRDCALKVLATLKSAVTWIMPRALCDTRCFDRVCKGLEVPDIQLQTTVVELFFAFFNRVNGIQSPDEATTSLWTSMLQPERVSTLRNLYRSASVTIDDLDDQKYGLTKKISEVVSVVGGFLEHQPSAITKKHDLNGFLEFSLQVLQHLSLVVSIPALHMWTRILRSRVVEKSENFNSIIGTLLETCTQRLFRYESLGEDANDPTIQFLEEDFDTIPERHAFLGNYRRYCVDVVETIVRIRPFEAMYHIMDQATTTFKNLYSNGQVFRPENYTKSSIPALRADAQGTIVDAALKGYLKCIGSREELSEAEEGNHQIMLGDFERFCQKIWEIPQQDPEIKRKIVLMLSTFATKALISKPSLGTWLVEQFLMMGSTDRPEYPSYSDAAKALETDVMQSLQRLAMFFPDQLINNYEPLERRVAEIVNDDNSDERRRYGAQAFLFIIIHRTAMLDEQTRRSRLRMMLQPVADAWKSSAVQQACSSFQAFNDALGMGNLPRFLMNRQFHKIRDWSTQDMDAEGQAMQTNILARVKFLPLRLTKTMLSASSEKLRDSSSQFILASELWSEIVPSIVPNLLKLLEYSQTFTNLQQWSDLPSELQPVMKRILTDRFWQAGISSESKDDFYAKINSTRTSYEGFASTIRGTVRQVRETCYFILYGMTQFKEQFYGFQELPEPLAHSLCDTAVALSTHQLSVLLSMSAALIEGCPPTLRSQFLPPIIKALFRLLDNRISSEWDLITAKSAEAAAEDHLKDEMKTESILRQLTHSTILLIANLLENHPVGSPISPKSTADSDPQVQNMRSFILANPSILEPLILFCTHALRMRDSRCCGVLTRVLRGVVPEFATYNQNSSTAPIASQVREFISTEALKACITSLHEPYFVDLQRDLAALISNIVALYTPFTQTPRSVLLSLPEMGEEKVDRALTRLTRQGASERYQRAVIMDLLQDLRGVSIHEQGRMERAEPKKKNTIQQRYMEVEARVPRINTDDGPSLEGVSDMFGAG